MAQPRTTDKRNQTIIGQIRIKFRIKFNFRPSCNFLFLLAAAAAAAVVTKEIKNEIAKQKKAKKKSQEEEEMANISTNQLKTVMETYAG